MRRPIAFAPLILIVASLLALVAAACSSSHDTSGDPVTAGGMTNTVDIRDFDYKPGNLRVPVGARVTWVNHDIAPHTATARDDSWDTGTLNRDGSKTLTFDKPGDYSYYCRIHPSMKARIEVAAAS